MREKMSTCELEKKASQETHLLLDPRTVRSEHELAEPQAGLRRSFPRREQTRAGWGSEGLWKGEH